MRWRCTVGAGVFLVGVAVWVAVAVGVGVAGCRRRSWGNSRGWRCGHCHAAAGQLVDIAREVADIEFAMPIFAKGDRVVAIDSGIPVGNRDMIGRTTDRANFLIAKVSVEIVTKRGWDRRCQ